MDTQRIDAALRQASDTRRVVIEAGALGAVDETFAQCFENAPAVVVADDNTFAAAGRAVQERLSAAGRTLEPPIVFPGAPALYERVLQRDMRALDIDGLCRAWPSRETVERMVRQGHDIPQLAENAVEESLAKYITPEQLRERLELI